MSEVHRSTEFGNLKCAVKGMRNADISRGTRRQLFEQFQRANDSGFVFSYNNIQLEKADITSIIELSTRKDSEYISISRLAYVLRLLRGQSANELSEHELSVIAFFSSMLEQVLFNNRLVDLSKGVVARDQLPILAFFVNNCIKIMRLRKSEFRNRGNFDLERKKRFIDEVDEYVDKVEASNTLPEHFIKIYRESSDYIKSKLLNPHAAPGTDLYFLKDIIVAAAMTKECKPTESLEEVVRTMLNRADTNPFSRERPTKFPEGWEDPALWTAEIGSGNIEYNDQHGRAGVGKGSSTLHFDPRAMAFAAAAIEYQKVKRADSTSN